MEFKKYQHLERIGTVEVEGIEQGTCYCFPKLDGSNGSIWLSDDNTLGCGSRNRELSMDDDNAGFMAWAVNQPSILRFHKAHPNIRLFVEW